MDFKDYYKTLGVTPDADGKAIRQAFRQLARKVHPDLNPGNKEAEEKFKEINEAHQVLSDAKQRQKYDELRAQYLHWQQKGSPQKDFDWQNWSAQPGQPGHTQSVNAEDLEDLFGGETPFSDFFTTIFGGQATPGRGGRRASPPGPRRGRNVEYALDLTLEEAYRGAERLLELDGHRITASIPPGVRSGTRVRLAGQGEPGRNGASAGDLYLITNILPHDTYERDGNDLHIDVPVDIFTAIAGGEVRIPALERPLILTIPPRTHANRSFRVRGKGMPHLGLPGKHGDLFARVRLVLPEALTDQEVDSIRALASARQERSRPDPKRGIG